MRLLFAIKSLNYGGGGAERVLADISNGLTTRGHEISILTFDRPNGESFYALDPSIKRIDIDIAQPGEPTPRAGFIRAIPNIRRLVRDSRSDLLIAFMHSTYVPMVGALLGCRIPIVASEHTDATHYNGRFVQRLLATTVELVASAKTVPSLSVWSEYPEARRARIHVLPNPIGFTQYSGTASAPDDPPHALCVGRLMYEKNHIDLIRAFARVAMAFPDWSLRIVGEGELRPELTAEISRLGMNGRISMPGVTRNVADAYAACSLVVLPSLYESFGLVAAEALAAGRPVISFDNCLGIAEMVQNGHNGLLVKGGASSDERVENLAMGLAQMMADPELRQRLGQAGPASVQRYALKSVLDTWEEFLLNTAAAAKERCAKKS